MTARTLYALPGPLPLTPSQLGRSGRFKLTSRTLETVRAELWTDAGADVVDVTNPGDSVAFPLLGLRAVHLSASAYPAHVLLESTELPLELDCAPQIGNTLTNPMPVTTGGPPGACTYSAPTLTVPTPRDLMGQYVSYGNVFHPAPSIPAFVVTTNSPSGAYGTPNDGSFWGLAAGVWAAQTVDASWVHDFGTPRHICTVELIGTTPFPAVELLLDGNPIVAMGGLSTGLAVPIATAFGQVLELHYSAVHGGGYYAGQNYDALLAWGLGL